ncbi:MATE family efflux transporter [Maritimibacter dapengensis]|uniref:Multidrug-efflux transporter n=1 Tax=Maritimibacter dapengensis TaxID=2836868 RepID=A0ABS6T0D1_9RHOB|nr:MATE family efflux transporter [Maritimibacter dapengensis]MBV7378213.1 MATE family efflux transporter [Maritimibacter dapengensis]
MSRFSRYRPHAQAHLALGLPLIGSQLAQVAITTADTLMMGWYDVRALAALVLSANLVIFLLLLSSGFAWAVMPLVAAAHEVGDETRLRRVTRMANWLSIIAAFVFLPVFWWSAPVLRALGQDPELAEMAQTYLRIAGFGIGPALLVNVLRSYLSGLERTRVQFWIIAGGAVVNIGLNWVLIFGNLGAPELGLRGAAIASVSVHVLSFVALAFYALSRFPNHEIFVRFWRPDWGAMGEVFRMGWQIALTTVSEVGLFNLSAIIMGWIGTLQLAAHGIALQIATITFMVQLGLSQAATVRAGRAFGRGDREGLRDGAFAVWALGLGFAGIAMAAFFLVPDLLIGAFIDPDDPLRGDILAIGAVLLAMAALFQLVDAAQVIGISLLRGMTDTRVPLVIAAVSYWGIGAPASYLLGVQAGIGAVGVWIGLVLGLSFAAVGLFLRFRSLSVAV